MLWVIIPVIKLLVSKVFPIPIIFVPQSLLQPAFIEDLGISRVQNPYYLPLTAHTAPNPVFFFAQ